MSTLQTMLDSASGTTILGSGAAWYMSKDAQNVVSNAVTINAQSGVMTTSSITINAGGSYAITLTNSFITNVYGKSFGNLYINQMGGTGEGACLIQGTLASSTTATITIYNWTGSNITGTFIIGFIII